MIRACAPLRIWKLATPNPEWTIPSVVRNISSFQQLPPPNSAGSNRRVSKPDIHMIRRRFLHSGRKMFGDKSPANIVAAVSALVGLIGGGIAYSMKDRKEISMDVAQCESCDDDSGPCIEKKCEDAPCLRKNECLENIIMKANGDLEKALKDTKGKAMEYTEAAMKAYCEAIKIVQEYLDQGYCIIDNDELETPAYEEVWCCLYTLAKKRCEKVKDAIQKGQCAWELLMRLREVVEAGKACKYTSCNPLLVTAEESLICAERELLNLKSRLDCVATEHEMAEIFKGVLSDFKKDLKADLDAIPEEQKCKVQYVEQEIALMIEQAYKKAVRAQRELAQVLVCQGRIPEKQQETMC